MTEQYRRGPYARGVLRKQQIVDKALEVFNEQGADRTSLRSIADTLGVTHPALRHHFGSREQLFLEVLRQADERGREELAARADAGAADLAAALSQTVLHQPGFMALYNTMVGRALEKDNEHSREFFADRYQRMRSEIMSVLEAGRGVGAVRDDIDLWEAAALIIAASDGLSTQWLLDRDVDFEAIMRLLDRLLAPET